IIFDGKFKSATMRLMMAACCQSFAPKTATSGSTRLKSLATTVVTPRKCVGRDAPSIVQDKVSSTTQVLHLVGTARCAARSSQRDDPACGYISLSLGVNTTSTPVSRHSFRSRLRSRGYLEKS